jgi:hypothetical protein
VSCPDGRRLVFVRAGIQFTSDGRGVLFSAAKEGEAERCYLLPVE